MIVLYLTCYIAPGIYHGTLNFDPNSDDHIDSTQLHPYPAVSPDAPPGTSAAEVPVSISLTEFRFILLYRDCYRWYLHLEWQADLQGFYAVGKSYV
jgi:hypothetical protein